MTVTAVEAAAQDTTAPQNYSKTYRFWLLAVLLFVNALNLADRQGMAITAPAIKHDLQLSDTQLGLLMGLGFAIFFSLLALPIARLAERSHRARIIAISVGVLGVMLGFCSVARNFWQFLLCRVGVGAGDAGFGPPVASLLGDHYPSSKRASANSIIWLGAPVGAILGSVAGGWIAQHMGWRVWFAALAVPSLVIGLLAFFTLREPPRGMADGVVHEGPPPSMTKVIGFLWSKKSMRQILLGAGFAAIGLNGLGQFFARYFASNFHMGLAQAGAIMGLMAGISMASGLALGGFGVDWAAKRDRRWFVWGPAIALVLAAPIFFVGIAQANLVAALLILMAGHVALFVYWTPTIALAQNMVGANMRASSAFVGNLVLGLVGIGLGPTLAGIFSDLFAQQAFAPGDFATLCKGGAAAASASSSLVQACADASAAGVRHSIMALSLFFGIGGICYFLAARDVRKDLDTVYAA